MIKTAHITHLFQRACAGEEREMATYHRQFAKRSWIKRSKRLGSFWNFV